MSGDGDRLLRVSDVSKMAYGSSDRNHMDRTRRLLQKLDCELGGTLLRKPKIGRRGPILVQLSSLRRLAPDLFDVDGSVSGEIDEVHERVDDLEREVRKIGMLVRKMQILYNGMVQTVLGAKKGNAS